MKKIIKGAVVGGVVMLLLGVFIQLFPWGFADVKPFPDKQSVSEAILSQTEEGMYYTDEGTYALIAVSSPGWNSIPRKLLFDLITQFILAGIISFVLSLTASLKNRTRIALITCMSLAASIGVYIPDWNWWGFSLRYTLGASLNLVFVWTVAAVVLTRFVLKKENVEENIA